MKRRFHPLRLGVSRLCVSRIEPSRLGWTVGLLSAAVWLFAACTTLTPAQEQSNAEVLRFAERTTRVYGLPSIHVLVSHDPDDPPGSFGHGFFSVSSITLMSTFRDAIVAHELAHYVLGHDAPLPGDSYEEQQRAYQEREQDANAKSVEILQRVGGMSEERALRTVYAYLLGVHWAFERYPRLKLSGHKPPCEEIGDLLTRFPGQRAWTDSLECARPGLSSVGG